MNTTIVQIQGQVINPNVVGLNDVVVHIDSTQSNTRTKFGMRLFTNNLSSLEIVNVTSGDALIYTSSSATTGGVTKKNITNVDLWVGVGKFDVIVHNIPNIKNWNCWSPNATYELNKLVPLLQDGALELICQTSNYESDFDISNLSRFKSMKYIGLTGKKIYGALSSLSDSEVGTFGFLHLNDSYVYGSIATDLTAHNLLIGDGDFSGSLITA